MIEIRKLVKNYGKINVLNNIDLKIAEGEIFGIIGPSGAGKSTLIRNLNLLEKPSSGQILIDGEDLTSLSPKLLRKKRQEIGMIFQHFNLLSSRTVAGNISFPLEIAGMPKNKRDEKVARLIELVGLEDRAGHYPAQLSGGQKQRVGIARALANNPRLLLSDEATSSLDPESTEAILKLLMRIRDELNLTIVLITHEMEVIKHICDRVAVMEKGQIIEEGKVVDLFANPTHKLTKRFIKSILDFKLPDNIFDNLEGELVRVSFVGEATHQALVSSLVKSYKVDANILYGKVEDIQGVSFGTLILRLVGESERIRRGVSFLKNRGLRVEVLSDDRRAEIVN